jgi:hypothetical protein
MTAKAQRAEYENLIVPPKTFLIRRDIERALVRAALAGINAMSALPPKADIRGAKRNVRLVECPLCTNSGHRSTACLFLFL